MPVIEVITLLIAFGIFLLTFIRLVIELIEKISNKK
ncbi:putative holin-like toxin [Fructobacillus pseudoficulneus]|nr:putative holin-like toxin [Fructobacillus pseudoficulneus]